YCATRRQTEELAAFLRDKGFAAGHFHGQLPPETKKGVQERFLRGELRVIVATNAFGMGIDKPDVRLVIHADIPGSLENYLQEAGRAGRDRQAARCVLLYTPDDVERQFGMSARSRLTQREIQAVLRALRRLDRKRSGRAGAGAARRSGDVARGSEVVATPGEILAEDEDGDFERDSATDDSRVRTAIAWLEEAALLSREENRVQVFPSSLRVASMDEARARLARAPMAEDYRRRLLALVEALIGADADEGISTDELMGMAGLSAEKVRAALYDLERLGIASNDTALTAFVHAGVERSSARRLEAAAALEAALIDDLREAAPDLARGEASVLHLRHAAQRLKDAGHARPVVAGRAETAEDRAETAANPLGASSDGAGCINPILPETLWRILRSLAADGRSEDGGAGSLGLRRLDAETVQVSLRREWSALAETARRRRAAAARLLEHWLSCLPPGARGVDLLAETTLGRLLAALEGDLVLKAEARDLPRLLDRALMWLHEQEVIRLNKGLAVFRPAMTLRLGQERRGFGRADFAPLKLHYDEQVVHIHVMAEYARRGLQAMAEALRLAMDYFCLAQEEFLRRWLPGRDKELARQTTPQSWREIVESLRNPAQARIVADEREQTNVLVLAGPGSGKTRVLVHRIAYLVRVRRDNPHGILALAYNRHAAVQIRRRLAELIGDDARGVSVLTCHALAMRLAGVSFAGRAERLDEAAFRSVLLQAVARLKGDDLPPEEREPDGGAQRERLMAGFRWILVDEYQDIGPEQYELISALAGRTLADEERRLSLFAVGDDDQNIYAFQGASVEFIRRFEADYGAKPAWLTENYRSSAHIIAAANAVIAPARARMKAGQPITIDRARAATPAGGEWSGLDAVSQGRVQVLSAGADALTQAVAVMAELQRLAALAPAWDWARTAVIAREWKYLEPVRSHCELLGIAVQMADEEAPNFWRLRETRALLDWLLAREPRLIDAAALERWLDGAAGACGAHLAEGAEGAHATDGAHDAGRATGPAPGAAPAGGPWFELLREAVQEYTLETGGAELPIDHFTEWLAEWGREVRRRQGGLLLLTAHRAKGLEFDHVAVLDGGWDRVDRAEDPDAPRRLYYVAMTRARATLALARLDGRHALLDALPEAAGLLRRAPVQLAPPAPELARQYRRLTLAEVDLGYAGRRAAAHPVHRAIAALVPGSPLRLRLDGEQRELVDEQGRVVGRLARACTLPPGMACIAARVVAIVVRLREDSEPEYRDRLRCERWEVVVPELVLAPQS
ncbi:MAG: AAA family ATPase, partial [Betaproteobacteria bacterium]|nr:AAA family ATPase [Betaproteobacteria bacterium]